MVTGRYSPLDAARDHPRRLTGAVVRAGRLAASRAEVPRTAKRTMKVLVTGGAGFIGANLAIGLAAGHPDWQVTALDNLQRRGSELNLPRLRAGGVRFVHGDIRTADDLLAVGQVDAVVECSAEPSVLAGVDGSGLDRIVGTNLFGAYACLELCRRHEAQLVFLSTSRVYPVDRLRTLPLTEGPTRFQLDDDRAVPGATGLGISEDLSLDGHRTPYGATKLSGELLIAGVCGDVRLAVGREPLRRDRRPVADGQGRPGSLYLLDARSELLWYRPGVHRFRRLGKAGARFHPRRRCRGSR